MENINFEPKEEYNPYAAGRREYDDLVGGPLKQAANWRKAFFVVMLALFFSIGGIIYQSQKSEVAPYIVEVHEGGEVKFAGKIKSDTRWEPTEAVIKHFIARWVTDIRTIPIDPILMRQNFLNAYKYVTPNGKVILDQYCQKLNPFEAQRQKIKVLCQINNILAKGKNSYQAEWTEEMYGAGGVKTKGKKYTALFEVAMKRPKKPKDIMANPIGLFIDFFNISEKLY